MSTTLARAALTGLLALTAAGASAGTVVLTHQRLDGNRVLAGRGPGADARVVDVALPGPPAWVLAAASGTGTTWLVALEDGRVARIEVDARGAVGRARLDVERLPPGAPPAGRLRDGELELLTRTSDTARWTHPVPIGPAADALARITTRGTLVLGPDERPVAGVQALPDARILVDAGRMLVLGEPTERYGHGVLGDAVESGAAIVIDARRATVVARIDPPGERVIEGLAPIWGDLDGDGQREIVVTESDIGEGARLVAYDEQGRLVATSEPIGLGYRWRHQIGVGTTLRDAPPELVSVRTPHLGGVVEFFRLKGDRLQLTASIGGVSSHAIGSRNLDLAALADWNGDDLLDLLVPARGHHALVVVSRTATGAAIVARLDAAGRIATNLAGVAMPGGGLQLGLGTADGRLRLWGAVYSSEE
jgi:hypothetical protein